MFYILQWAYVPNTASENRIQAYLRALNAMGTETTVVYLYPDKKYHKNLNSFANVHLVYYWNRFTPYRGFFRKLTFGLYIKRFLRNLRSGDAVYTYHINKLIYYVQGISGVRTFAEMTEHPEASDGIDNPILYISDAERTNIAKRLDGLFVITEALRKYFVSTGVEESKVHVINMIVDSSRFDGLVKSPNRERYIAYCGNASNNKDGVDELIKAFALVAKRFKDIKLYIIGKKPGLDDNSGNLQLVRKLQIEDKVLFIGIIPSSQIPQILVDAEILALDRPDSLQAQYGFPTKMGEYLLSKNPVVVTKVGDIPIFLHHKENAMLAKERNAEEFANCICWLIENTEQSKIIGMNGYETALVYFNSNIETKKLNRVISLSM